MERDYGVFGNLEDVAVVRGVYDAFARRDMNAVLELLAEDVEFVPAGTQQAAGRTHAYKGHGGVRAYFVDVEALWDELELQPDDIRAAAGGVVVFGTVRGRRGDEHVSRRATWTWKLRDGLVVSMRATDMGPA